MIRFACSHDGSHTYMTTPRGQFTVSPAPKGAGFQISQAGLVVEDGFANRDAAVAQAEWLLTEA